MAESARRNTKAPSVSACGEGPPLVEADGSLTAEVVAVPGTSNELIACSAAAVPFARPVITAAWLKSRLGTLADNGA